MQCERCQEKPATVRIRRTINNQTSEEHLCQQCAQEAEEVAAITGPEFSLPAFFAGLLDAEKPGQKPRPQTHKMAPCPACGLTYTEFRQAGRLGCDQCYQAFAQGLEPLLRRVHGRTDHSGKSPAGGSDQTRVGEKLEQLREEMHACVEQEEFERAAELRDRIRELERQLRQGGSED